MLEWVHGEAPSRIEMVIGWLRASNTRLAGRLRTSAGRLRRGAEGRQIRRPDTAFRREPPRLSSMSTAAAQVYGEVVSLVALVVGRAGEAGGGVRRPAPARPDPQPRRT